MINNTAGMNSIKTASYCLLDMMPCNLVDNYISTEAAAAILYCVAETAGSTQMLVTIYLTIRRHNQKMSQL
jgi:hypothetical protein